MNEAAQPIVNIADVALRESGHGERFAVGIAEIGDALGLTNLGCMLHVVPPGNGAADAVEYPDSGKVGIRVGAKGIFYADATFKQRGRIAEASYWDGEE